MYQQPVDVFTSDTSILQDSSEEMTVTTTVPELFHDPTKVNEACDLLSESPPSQLPKTVTIHLSSSNATKIHQDLKLPNQLLVTPHGLVSQSVSPSSSPEKILVTVETTNRMEMMDTFPYSDDSDKALMKIVSGDNKSLDGKKIDGSTQSNDVSNDFDADINTIVITNDETGEIKMTFSDNAVAQYEEIVEKSEQKESETNIGDSSLETVGMSSFTALHEREDRFNGVSPVRKSDRSIKLNSVFGDEDAKKIPGFGKVLAAHMMKDSGVDAQTAKSGGKKNKAKRSRKQMDPKKTKLHVDDVYESGEGEGLESDGDLSKDLLKVRMLKCDSCGKHFLDKNKLQAHKKTHNKRKKCTVILRNIE